MKPLKIKGIKLKKGEELLHYPDRLNYYTTILFVIV